jgi:uncharacterized protein YbbK (DUF523 family)
MGTVRVRRGGKRGEVGRRGGGVVPRNRVPLAGWLAGGEDGEAREREKEEAGRDVTQHKSTA